MRTMVTVLLFVAFGGACFWAWSEWSANGWRLTNEELGQRVDGAKGAVDRFGAALCRAWGC